ncbi:carbohydrate deacetylase isoform X2 [Kryptolebias marmoratus]|uniref:Carbohydrate deacetylase n=1 Tax=Kryptolebias marmoratus TaxID=37003 RepID=A0A3Q3GGU0_KRYMA|nr:carbohydrate deacetylase isoform X2 [Kryptolebias marmoratus]
MIFFLVVPLLTYSLWWPWTKKSRNCLNQWKTTEMPQPRLMLVVTGDDFGYCPRRNQGIVDCFLGGGVSNVSLLVNASAAKQAADLAERHRIPIGLHANLSEGAPVSQNLQQVSTLINSQGFFHGKMGFRQALEKGQLSMNQVELELRAQVRQFVKLTGHLPHHMDGHQHVHVLPDIREVFAHVLSDLRILYTRVPVEPGLQNCPWLPEHLQSFYIKVEKDALDSIPVFKRHGIRWPDVYLGLTTMGQNMSFSSLQRAIKQALAAGLSDSRSRSGSEFHQSVVTAELMVHPGYPSYPKEGGCGEGPDDFSQSAERHHELSVLTDPSVLDLYQQERVQLCGFKDLNDLHRPNLHH